MSAVETPSGAEKPGTPETQDEALFNEESVRNESFRQQHPIIWWTTLLGPIIATAALLAVLGALYGAAFVRKLVAIGLATSFLLGRFVILGGDDPELREAHRFLTRGELMMMVIWLDLIVACVLAYHVGFLFKLPVVGPRLAGLVDDGRFILRINPWMRRATFAGLVAFVMFPLAATGSVGGSIFGRLLGLSRLGTFSAVMTGSVLGSSLMYFGAGLINRYIGRDNPWLFVSGIVVVLGVLFLLNARYQRMKKAALARPSHSP